MSEHLTGVLGVILVHSDSSAECPSLSTTTNSTISSIVTELEQTKAKGTYRTKKSIASWSKAEITYL